MLSDDSGVLSFLAFVGIQTIVGGIVLFCAFVQHGKSWRRKDDAVAIPSLGKATGIFLACEVFYFASMPILLVALIILRIVPLPQHGDQAPLGLHMFFMLTEYFAAAGIIRLTCSSLTYARACVLALYPVLVLIAGYVAFQLTLPATSEKTQAETAENWQEIIRDSGRDEAEKANLLSWAKDSNGISLLKHLSVWTSVDNGPYHTVLTPIANRLAWKDAFAVATSGAKRQVLLYSSSGFRPFLSAIVITDGEGRLIRWVAPTIKDDVGRAAILNTEKGTELAVDPACEYFYDVYSSEPRGPQRCRNVYRFLLRDDGITQLDVKHCDPDTLFGPTPRAVIESH